MVRCKCGRWTNFGITCSQCRVSTVIIPHDSDEEPEVVAADEELVEVIEELEENEEDVS